MGPIKAFRTRSRSGCSTCKTRRVKCDENKPICRRCVKLGLQCTYQDVNLMWEDEADKRGITFGRSLEARNKRSNILPKKRIDHKNMVVARSSYLFINVTPNEIELLSNGKQIGGTLVNKDTNQHFTTIFKDLDLVPKAKNFDAFDFIFDDLSPLSFDEIFLDSFAPFPITQIINVSEPHIDQCSFNLDPTERALAAYFIESIGPFCVCCEVKPSDTLNSYIAPELNPYLYLIVPLAFKSRLVMNTILAASATQLSLLGKDEYKVVAQDYLVQVTSEISKLIELKKDNDDWDDFFAIIIMLCFIEISVNCNNSWLVLLHYAKKVLKESSKSKEKILTPLGKFFIRYFISHEVMGETAWVHDSHMNQIQEDPFIEDLKKDYDTKIDLVFGCSPFLISLIHRISVIGQCLVDMQLESSRELYTQEILEHAVETEEMLKNLKQQLPTNSEIHFDVDGIRNISTISEIKRLGALLYLYGMVYMNSSFHSTRLDPVAITREIIELTTKLPDCYMSLLWPLFVIGLVTADDEETRWFVLDSLQRLERKRKLKTVQAAREIIVNIWKEKDLGNILVQWKEMIKGKATTISLA